MMAEGYFTEVYDKSSKKELIGFFKVNKKAFIVSRAKVSVGKFIFFNNGLNWEAWQQRYSSAVDY